MKSKYSKKKLVKMIDSGFSGLTEEEIKSLISKELAKDEDKINMDYIDVCYSLLEAKKGGNAQVKVKKIKKPFKVLVAAAVIMLLAVSTTVAFADYFEFDIPKSIAEYKNGDAELDFDLSNADTSADGYKLTDTALAKQLAEFGITPVTLPEEMVNGNCKITKVENSTIDETISKDATINFEFKGAYGDLFITQYPQVFEESAGVSTVMDVVSGRMIQVNGMDVLVFEGENACTIKYKDNLTEYSIHLFNDIDTVVEFAKTIK